jgi:hypothetical protein
MNEQVAASNLRFGDGVTAEVGMDLKNMKARKVRENSVVFTSFQLHFILYVRLQYSPTLTWPTYVR